MINTSHWSYDEAPTPYYIFDLNKYRQLGRHRPYFEVIRSTVATIAVLNPSYDPRRTCYDLEELVSDALRDSLQDVPYIEESLNLIAVLEHAVLDVLRYVTEFDRYLIICVDARLIDNLLIIGLEKWI